MHVMVLFNMLLQLVVMERDIQHILEEGQTIAQERDTDLTPEVVAVARNLGINTDHAGFAQRDELGRYYLGLESPFFVRRHNNVC